jgi:hypothetical protein
MSTYLIKEDFTITRQQGDISDVVFVLQNTLPLTGLTVKFHVFNTKDECLLAKISPTDITVLGQQITIPLLKDDTETLKGTLRWECELTSSTKRITIGKGAFVVVKTHIP